MKIKKYLLEQVNMKAQDKLKRALSLGCIAKYTNFIIDKNEPVLVDFGGKDIWAISGKGKTSKKQYYFLAEPMVLVDVEEAAKNPSDRDPNKPLTREWSCDNLELNDEQKKYLESLNSELWTLTRPTTKDLDDGVYLAFDLVSGNKYTPTGYTQTTNSDTQFNLSLIHI